MKLIEFRLDENRADYWCLNIAINPDYIMTVEPDEVMGLKTEYECATITMNNGTKYFVKETYGQVLKKING